jgi:succinate dehydrogenase / fumarate reductase, iron-sulfur subunit
VVIVVPRYTPAWDDDGMAEAAQHQGPAGDPADERANDPAGAGVGSDIDPSADPGAGRRSRMKPLPDGHLPVTEVTFDRAGAASPFGDDVIFPLPADRLLYTHSTTP